LRNKYQIMANEERGDSIGGPEPVDPGAVESAITQVIVAVAVTAGGLIAFAALTMPTRTAGATRSSRLRWEERQQQIETAVKAQDAGSSAEPSGQQ
jgi:hypothetical protein